MKKLLLIFAAITLLVGILFATKPSEIVETEKAIPQEKKQKDPLPVEQKGPAEPLVAVTENQCKGFDKVYLLQEELDKKLAEQLLAFKDESQGIDEEKLMGYAEAGLGNKRLIRHMAPKNKASTEHKPNVMQELFSGNEDSKKVMEDIFMLSIAGKYNEVINKFHRGELGPFNAENDSHKQLLAGILIQTSGQKGLNIYNQFYSPSAAIPQGLAGAMLAAESSTENIQAIIARIDQNEPEESVSFYGNTAQPLAATLAAENYKAAELLLDSETYQIKMIDRGLYARNIEAIPESLVNKLLNRGYQVQTASLANGMANKLKESSPQLAARFEQMAAQMNAETEQVFARAPQEFQQLVANYKEERKALSEKINACNLLKAKTRPLIPEYQPIDKKEIEQNIIALQTSGNSQKEIIINLSAHNKETVEYAYQFFAKQNKKNINFNRMNEVPQDIRDLMGFMHQKNWQGIIDVYKKGDLSSEWGLNAYSMIPEFKKRGADDYFIEELVRLGGKKALSSKDLQQLTYNLEGTKVLLDYGANLNQVDENNKTFLYQLVKRGDTSKLDEMMAYGLNFQPDPYGYDSLDAVLRKGEHNNKRIKSLANLAFPITEAHLDYSKYLKQYYPERYQGLVEAMPALKVEGLWRENSDQNVN